LEKRKKKKRGPWKKKVIRAPSLLVSRKGEKRRGNRPHSTGKPRAGLARDERRKTTTGGKKKGPIPVRLVRLCSKEGREKNPSTKDAREKRLLKKKKEEFEHTIPRMGRGKRGLINGRGRESFLTKEGLLKKRSPSNVQQKEKRQRAGVALPAPTEGKKGVLAVKKGKVFRVRPERKGEALSPKDLAIYITEEGGEASEKELANGTLRGGRGERGGHLACPERGREVTPLRKKRQPVRGPLAGGERSRDIKGGGALHLRKEEDI